ncbi:DUF309 domain-containing protein [Denitrobaculum tricleocarpae]|uniref:DUF309 domain-containing protein n=1 Tax=Denitrobaculum tricleocarpae TaxID=2591009 RepID=A0A545TQP0_9PROT|nr:DUF309 domain-containing protein [Denitrobaculum tricleocarpae]TQV79542.1 DUF309 domain-containing protein [Denitrobaculum tricleocarpae]
MTALQATSPLPTLPGDVVALPARPHHPGTGSVADMALLEEVKQACPERTDPGKWRQNRTYRYGWSLFEAGFYWEAHEVWEPVWLACRPNSLEKSFLRAAIQLTNACLKDAMGKTNAARRLFDEVEGLVSELKTALGAENTSYMGVDMTRFARRES